jgi:hypothetical protein
VQLNANAGHNMFYSVEMEGNSQFDVLGLGGAKNNGFLYCGNDGNLKTSFGLLGNNWATN